MIRIYSEGTELRVAVDIPKHLTGGAGKCYNLGANLGGSQYAVEALAREMAKQLRETIETIRKEAYAEGAKDRAMQADLFSDELKAGEFRGGCYGSKRRGG